jgi:hypothetical protein
MKFTLKTVLAFCAAASFLYAGATETAKAEIGRQFELLKKGDLQKLKARFTDRQKERVTAEKVKKAQADIQNYTIDDLVASTIEGEYQGKRTIKIKMKNGRTLTTLIQEGSEWYSDTIWFR